MSAGKGKRRRWPTSGRYRSAAGPDCRPRLRSCRISAFMLRLCFPVAGETGVQLPACPALLTIWTTPLRSPAGAGRRHAMTHLPSPEWSVSPDLTDYPPALVDREPRAAPTIGRAEHGGRGCEDRSNWGVK